MAIRTTIFLVLFMLLCPPPIVIANNKAFDKSQWQSITENYDYTEDFKELKQKERKVNRKNNNFDFELLFRILIYILIAVVAAGLVYIIYTIAKNAFLGKANLKFGNKQKMEFGEIEDNLPDIDLKSWLLDALENGLYKEALRIRYLMLIQKLIALDLIAWKKNKTNGDFLGEMRNTSNYSGFMELTFVYERVWYGDFDLDRQNYDLLVDNFNQFADLLEK